MAVYTKGIETKRRLVMSMYKKLQKEDASKITAREFASENGCSAAAIYKHFESMEYLVLLGSVKFFMEYMAEYGALMDSDENLLKSYIKGWELFNRYAFERPDLYYRLIWGPYNEMFADLLNEYFELFSLPESERYPDYFYTLMFTSNIQERDFLMLRRAAARGLLSDDDAEYFSKTNTLIVKGMLEEAMEKDIEERKQIEMQCNKLIARNMENVL